MNNYRIVIHQMKRQIHDSVHQKRIYGTIRESAQATQAALLHSRAQTNPTVERGPPQRPKIKKLSKDKAAEKGTQTKDKEKQM